MNYTEAKAALARLLAPAAGEEASLEAGFLMEAVIGKQRRALETQELTRLKVMAQRRLTGEPLQYILGEWEFMGLPLYVSPAVLIPRPETELLCELALERLPRGAQVLDLCCGSGCIGIALHKLGQMQVSFSDISPKALELARRNARRHGIEADFYQGDLLSPLEDRCFDAILCNPPYLARGEMDTLQRELAFEPQNALFGGEDGLSFYRRLSVEAPKHLNNGGLLLMEIGSTQGQAVQSLFPGSKVYRDLSSLDRTVVYKKE